MFLDNLGLLSDRPYITSSLLVLGSLSVARVTFKTLAALTQTFLIPGTSLTKFGAKRGSWAVVTGASDGIGREFALQLAKAGFNVFLIARNLDALNDTVLQIENESDSEVATKIHVFDFSKNDEEDYTRLAAAIDGLDIGVLINNVGRGHSIPANFVDVPKDEIDAILTINIGATLRVTYAILPKMIKQNRGLILNVGSFAGTVPCPMLATYSASKAFLTTFSAALAEEVKGHNITVENLNTYFVVSKLSKIRRPSLFIPYPAPYVRSVLAKIGLACGAAYTGRPHTSTPYWAHALLDWAINLVPDSSILVRYSHGLQVAMRRKALVRAARNREEKDGKA